MNNKFPNKIPVSEIEYLKLLDEQDPLGAKNRYGLMKPKVEEEIMRLKIARMEEAEIIEKVKI